MNGSLLYLLSLKSEHIMSIPREVRNTNLESILGSWASYLQSSYPVFMFNTNTTVDRIPAYIPFIQDSLLPIADGKFDRILKSFRTLATLNYTRSTFRGQGCVTSWVKNRQTKFKLTTSSPSHTQQCEFCPVWECGHSKYHEAASSRCFLITPVKAFCIAKYS